VGPDGAAWITDGGQNAIVRVDPKTRAVKVFPLGKDAANANLNTLTVRRKGPDLVYRAERLLRAARSRRRAT
jgi:virginiamycin B lyase